MSCAADSAAAASACPCAEDAHTTDRTSAAVCEHSSAAPSPPVGAVDAADAAVSPSDARRIPEHLLKDVDFHGADFEWQDIVATAEAQIATAPKGVSLERAPLIEDDLQMNWNAFYASHPGFFQPKNYIYRLWPEVLDPAAPTYNPHTVAMEAGCGTGACMFGIMARNPGWRFHAFDFADVALDELRMNEMYDPSRANVFCWDVAGEELPPGANVPPASVDVIFCVFMLSAVFPGKHEAVLRRFYELLKPGGVVLFRDFGVHDMRSLKFVRKGQRITDNLFLKFDNTTSFFFSKEYMTDVASRAGLCVAQSQYHCNRLVNRKTEETMYRIFLNCKLAKPLDADTAAGAAACAGDTAQCSAAAAGGSQT